MLKTKKNLNIFQVQKLIKKQYDEQKLLSELDGHSEIFEKRWHNWKNLFTNIWLCVIQNNEELLVTNIENN